MKNCKHILFLILLFLSGLIHAQIENVVIETYYESNRADSIEISNAGGMPLDSGTTTYRIYIDLMPGSKLTKIYGDLNHPLKFSSTAPFFNNVDGFTFGKDFNNLNFHKNPARALDTWITIGQTTKTVAGKTNYGILKSQDRNGSTISIAGGDIVLTNQTEPMGIFLTNQDGMDTINATPPASWFNQGFLTSGIDSTMFGSTIVQTEFVSHNAILRNSGVRGVIPDSNQVLIAQLTTKGKIAFELNLVIEELINGAVTTSTYVAKDSALTAGEKYNPYLKYPAACGCQDPKYLEYDKKFVCSDTNQCKHLIVFGCTDTMACNYDPKANFPVKGLCCYQGSCGGREISTVCPSVNGDTFEFDIYPNPTQENIFLNILSGNSQEIKYSIFDTFGTLVLDKNLGTSNRIVNELIDLSNIQAGLYLLRLDFGGNSSSKLFLKN